MDRNAHKNKSAPIYTNKAHGDVRQDKNAPVRALSGSIEPAVVERAAYGQGEPAGKPKHHGSNRRRTVEIFTCVSQETFAIIEALRNQGGKHLSRSAVTARYFSPSLSRRLTSALPRVTRALPASWSGLRMTPPRTARF